MNQFERLELLIGNKINNIKDKTVLILGLGGVGSYSAEIIARNGISNIILVDNDKINITNLNRQLMTYQSNIDEYKTEEIKKRILMINPNCNIKIINEFITISNIDILFMYNPDYIIDACDTVSVKIELIKKCSKNKTKLISSMGTGNKINPSKMQIMDIRKTSYDPIAKVIRKAVKDIKIKGKIMVVCSDEVGYTKVKNIIPSNAYVPAVAGILCASYVINDIIGENNV